MIVAVAGCDLCSLDGEQDVIAPLNQKRDVPYSAACFILSPQPDLPTLPHTHPLFLLLLLKHWSYADLFGVEHCAWRLRHQKWHKRTCFSPLLSFWTKEDVLAQKTEELLAIPSWKQTDGHYCLGNVSVFNIITAVWFDVFIVKTQKTKKTGCAFGGFPFVSKAVLLSPSTVDYTECRCYFQLWELCISNKGNIWHSLKWQHFDDAAPRYNGLSHPPRQGWYYKRYHRHTNSCLSRSNSTVIISTMADSHTPVCYFYNSWSHQDGDH